MNAECPVCGYNWASDGMPEDGPVPYEENDKIGTLHFCSEECRAAYKEPDDGIGVEMAMAALWGGGALLMFAHLIAAGLGWVAETGWTWWLAAAALLALNALSIGEWVWRKTND